MCEAKFVLCHTQSQGAKYATHKMPLMLKMCHTLLKKELISRGNTRENDNPTLIPTMSNLLSCSKIMSLIVFTTILIWTPLFHHTHKHK